MISTVYIFTNGMTVVLDEHGEQVTELQGRFGIMAQKISLALHAQGEDNPVEILFAKWRGQEIPVASLESFDRLWRTTE